MRVSKLKNINRTGKASNHGISHKSPDGFCSSHTYRMVLHGHAYGARNAGLIHDLRARTLRAPEHRHGKLEQQQERTLTMLEMPNASTLLR